MNSETPAKPEKQTHANPDPLTGESGSHPIGTGIGAAAIGAGGMLVAAAVAGPVGIAAAALGGALIGGYVGKAAGELIDPTVEDAYWREQHFRQPYASRATYAEFQPAYRAGFATADPALHEPETFEEAEALLRTEYEKSGAALRWEEAREAAKASWLRAKQQVAAQRQGRPGRNAPR